MVNGGSDDDWTRRSAYGDRRSGADRPAADETRVAPYHREPSGPDRPAADETHLAPYHREPSDGYTRAMSVPLDQPVARPQRDPGEPLPDHLSPYRDQRGRAPAEAPPGYRPPPQRPGVPPTPPPARRKKRRWGRRIGITLLVLVLLIVGFGVYLDTSLTRVDALPDYAGRPAATPGTDWLLVGSDSREDLTEEEQSELATGFAEGKRTDTIILVHVPDADVAPTLVSLPRDTLVTIEGQGQQKLNAAYAFGGPQLLVRTVEGLTQIRIDRYAEIGLGGFADMVDAIGGVDVCLDQPIDDPKAGINLPAGCQELDGPKALGYVRTRATPRADLDRVVRQRQMLSIIVGKASSFGTLVNPFRSVPLALAATGTLTVDDGAHLWHLAGLGLAMGDGTLVTTTTPIAGTPTIDGIGSVVQIDEEKAAALFGALRADQAVPADLVTS